MASFNSLLLARRPLLLFSPFLALALLLLLFVGLSAMMLFEACKRGFKEHFLKNP